ncbi:hypothetical protein BLNAU_3759 [Blattamonas nauphoetae]|uniref:Uncharacterized protein n=1 Tax=Blattamonas nauphoetae TaxID=2049346 RepID=A0ABQ9YCB2_9EUKA|nr:hypothetical protein BLNAU_3759 [Blattamonas nauphoetae]
MSKPREEVQTFPTQDQPNSLLNSFVSNLWIILVILQLTAFHISLDNWRILLQILLSFLAILGIPSIVSYTTNPWRDPDTAALFYTLLQFALTINTLIVYLSVGGPEIPNPITVTILFFILDFLLLRSLFLRHLSCAVIHIREFLSLNKFLQDTKPRRSALKTSVRLPRDLLKHVYRFTLFHDPYSMYPRHISTPSTFIKQKLHDRELSPMEQVIIAFYSEHTIPTLVVSVVIIAVVLIKFITSPPPCVWVPDQSYHILIERTQWDQTSFVVLYALNSLLKLCASFTLIVLLEVLINLYSLTYDGRTSSTRRSARSLLPDFVADLSPLDRPPSSRQSYSPIILHTLIFFAVSLVGLFSSTVVLPLIHSLLQFLLSFSSSDPKQGPQFTGKMPVSLSLSVLAQTPTFIISALSTLLIFIPVNKMTVVCITALKVGVQSVLKINEGLNRLSNRPGIPLVTSLCMKGVSSPVLFVASAFKHVVNLFQQSHLILVFQTVNRFVVSSLRFFHRASYRLMQFNAFVSVFWAGLIVLQGILIIKQIASCVSKHHMKRHIRSDGLPRSSVMASLQQRAAHFRHPEAEYDSYIEHFDDGMVVEWTDDRASSKPNRKEPTKKRSDRRSEKAKKEERTAPKAKKTEKKPLKPKRKEEKPKHSDNRKEGKGEGKSEQKSKKLTKDDTEQRKKLEEERLRYETQQMLERKKVKEKQRMLEMQRKKEMEEAKEKKAAEERMKELEVERRKREEERRREEQQRKAKNKQRVWLDMEEERKANLERQRTQPAKPQPKESQHTTPVKRIPSSNDWHQHPRHNRSQLPINTFVPKARSKQMHTPPALPEEKPLPRPIQTDYSLNSPPQDQRSEEPFEQPTVLTTPSSATNTTVTSITPLSPPSQSVQSFPSDSFAYHSNSPPLPLNSFGHHILNDDRWANSFESYPPLDMPMSFVSSLPPLPGSFPNTQFDIFESQPSSDSPRRKPAPSSPVFTRSTLNLSPAQSYLPNRGELNSSNLFGFPTSLLPSTQHSDSSAMNFSWPQNDFSIHDPFYSADPSFSSVDPCGKADSEPYSSTMDSFSSIFGGFPRTDDTQKR